MSAAGHGRLRCQGRVEEKLGPVGVYRKLGDLLNRFRKYGVFFSADTMLKVGSMSLQ